MHTRPPTRNHGNHMTNQKKGGLPRPAPRKVPIDNVLTDEDTFQPRGGGLNEAHVAGLLEVLKQGTKLDPVALWEDPSTGTLTVADGHHRLEAYRRYGKDRAIPAVAYSCDKKTALLIPIQDNAKARLPLSHDDRANWAWKLTVEGEQSKARVVASCGVSDGTVARMRRVWRELKERGEDAPKTWWEAQMLHKGEERAEWTEEEREEWRQGLVSKAHRQYGAALADLISRSPEAAAELLELCGGRQLPIVLECLGYSCDEDGDEMDNCPF